MHAPVFIIGHPRSGTNYLKFLLACHPNINTLNEPFSLHLDYFIRQVGIPWKGSDYDGKTIIKGVHLSQHTIDKCHKIREYLSTPSQDIKLIKETVFLCKLPWLHEFIPNLKVLFLIRSPYRILDSFKKSGLFQRWEYESYYETIKTMIFNSDKYAKLRPLLNYAEKHSGETSKLMLIWGYRNSLALTDLPIFDYYKVIKYQDLIRDTSDYLEQIHELLQLGLHDNQISILKNQLHTTSKGNMYSSFRARKHQIKYHANYLSRKEIDQIEEMLDLLKECSGSQAVAEGYFDFPKVYTNPLSKSYSEISKIGVRHQPEQQKQEKEYVYLEDTKHHVFLDISKSYILVGGRKIANYPVTNAHFCAFLNTKHKQGLEPPNGTTYRYYNFNQERAKIKYIANGNKSYYAIERNYEDHPVTNVSWYGAKAFAQWLGVDLPSMDIFKSIFKIIESNPDFNISHLNIEERYGEIQSNNEVETNIKGFPYGAFVGNISKWVNTPEISTDAPEFSGGFNSPMFSWNQTTGRRQKDFGASNLGFHVLLPCEKVGLRRADGVAYQHQDIANILEYDEGFANAKTLLIDLGGTLHNFYTTSRIAMDAVYEHIHYAYPSVSIDSMKANYEQVALEARERGWVEDKPMIEYVQERFFKLLKYEKIEASTLFLDRIARLYQQQFELHTHADSSSIEVLEALYKQGYQLILVSEGSKENKRTTIQQLGLDRFFEEVVISSEVGHSKGDGSLYEYIIQKMALDRNSTIVIGDSVQNDIAGAQVCNLPSILVEIYNQERI